MSIRVPGTPPRTKVDFSKSVSRTKQSMKAECDINNIMRKYQRTGAIAHVRQFGGQYGDVSPVDFHEAMNTVLEAEKMFLALPATLRRRFDNDPAEFLRFVQDPATVEEQIELGLREAPKRPVVDSDKVDSAAAVSGEPTPAPA